MVSLAAGNEQEFSILDRKAINLTPIATSSNKTEEKHHIPAQVSIPKKPKSLVYQNPHQFNQ